MTKEECIEWALTVYERLRPKFYNKLTWVVVTAGLALVTSPVWWHEVIRQVLIAEFGIDVEVDISPWIGVSLVALGLIYHLIADKLGHLVEWREIAEELDHDAAIFNDFMADLKRTNAADIMEQLGGSHYYMDVDFDHVRSVVRSLSKPEKQFLSGELKEQASEVVRTFSDLCDYMAPKFDMYPHSQLGKKSRIVLSPYDNIDMLGTPDTMASYDKTAREFLGKLSVYNKAYETFVDVAHKTLKSRCV